MGERSIQYVINEAVKKTNIQKEVSMHTLRHSFATLPISIRILEDGVDIYSIQRFLGHADI
jgi:integrase/recombinase XerD